MILPALSVTIHQLEAEAGKIPASRKTTLELLANYMAVRTLAGQPAQLNFICTHNSRRSHLAQLWAQAASYYYRVPGVKCYSGGTEATAFNPRAVKAMQAAGFDIRVNRDGENPVYEVRHADDVPPVMAFSKTYDDPANPDRRFAAIMTCSHADQNCPVVIGCDVRIALTYDDPKDFDGTPQEEEKYRERVREIGREILWAFSRVGKH